MKKTGRLFAVALSATLVLAATVRYWGGQQQVQSSTLQLRTGKATPVNMTRPKTRQETFSRASAAALARSEAVALSRGKRPSNSGLSVKVPSTQIAKASLGKGGLSGVGVLRAATGSIRDGADPRIVKTQDYYFGDNGWYLAVWDWEDASDMDDEVAAEFMLVRPDGAWTLFYAELDFTDPYDVDQTYTNVVNMIVEWEEPGPAPAPVHDTTFTSDRVVKASFRGSLDDCCIKPSLGAAYQSGCMAENVVPQAFAGAFTIGALKGAIAAAWGELSVVKKVSGWVSALFGSVAYDASETLAELVADAFDSGVDCTENTMLYQLAQQLCGDYGIDWIEDDVRVGSGPECYSTLSR